MFHFSLWQTIFKKFGDIWHWTCKNQKPNVPDNFQYIFLMSNLNKIRSNSEIRYTDE